LALERLNLRGETNFAILRLRDGYERKSAWPQVEEITSWIGRNPTECLKTDVVRIYERRDRSRRITHPGYDALTETLRALL